MNVGISFTLLSFVYNVLLSMVYFRKERKNSYETSIYSLLVLITLFGSIEGIFCYLGVKNYLIAPVFAEIVAKGYLVFLLLWFSTFTVYVLYISNIDKYLNNTKAFKKIINILVILALLIFILIYLLPITYVSLGDSVYTTGSCVKCVYGLSVVYFIIWLVCVWKNIKKINKKFIPVFINIILLIIVVFVQKIILLFY